MNSRLPGSILLALLPLLAATCCALTVDAAEEENGLFKMSGTLAPKRDIVMKAQFKSSVVDTSLEEGAEVRKGDVIMKLDITELDLRLELARIAVEREKITEEKASEEYEKVKQFADRGNGSQAELNKAKRDLQLAELAVKEAELALENVARIQETGTLRAPFDGILIRLDRNAGDDVQEGDELLRIIDIDELVLTLRPPAKYHNVIKPGMEVLIKSGSLKGELKTRIETVVPEPESEGGFKVTATVSNRARNLIPGSEATAIVKLPKN